MGLTKEAIVHSGNEAGYDQDDDACIVQPPDSLQQEGCSACKIWRSAAGSGKDFGGVLLITGSHMAKCTQTVRHSPSHHIHDKVDVEHSSAGHGTSVKCFAA